MANRYATDAELIAVFPEIESAAASGLRDHYLDLTKEMLNLGVWETKASFGHLHLTAHFIAMHPGVSVAGATPIVSARKIEGLSVNYSVSAPTSDELSQTPYGRAYEKLRGGIFSTPIVGGMVIA